MIIAPIRVIVSGNRTRLTFFFGPSFRITIVVAIRKLRRSTVKFLIRKPEIFRKVKEIKDLSGGVVLYAAQSNAQIDAEIAEKGRFRTKTKSRCAMMIKAKDLTAVQGSVMLQNLSD